MAFFKNAVERLARPPEEIRAENLRRWAATLIGVTPITKIEPRRRCRAAGVVQNIRIDPRAGSGSIEATIIDGTGQMVARWLGRRTISGIRLGMGLIIEGIPGEQTTGELMVLNPEYELVPGPEHG
ncbi:MAG: DNA-binding protein [Actinomycetota bacterium]